MRFHSILIVSSLVSTATAVVKWYDPTETKNYEAYCTGSGALASTKHICFTANSAFFDADLSASNFHGIRSTVDRNNFVMLYIRKTSYIYSENYAVTVDFSLQDAGSSRNCAEVKITIKGVDSGVTVCQPGAQPVEIPTWSS
ncbi:uncharacterized protein UTRI_00316_B [Ustilago trichophora]|uniref:Uncharacterized protein n=1 Tax=Ustilago trichophora TaxID=86804 RepID=A0A5C3DP02_9BASI|nr:uncharacterized protein UTRI_00316_B [Ustilago trichophora]